MNILNKKLRTVECKTCGKLFSTKSYRAIFCSHLCGDRFRSKRPPEIRKCKWCGKEFMLYHKRGRVKQKYCSIKCREEYHSFNDKRSRFYRKDKDKNYILANSDLYVKCEICSQLARRRLSTHIKAKHQMSWMDYKKKYPNAKNECKEITDVIYPEIRKKKGIGVNSVNFKNGWDTIAIDRKEKNGNKCEYCGYDKYKESLIGHHKLPKQFGGKDRMDNCIIVCSNCHWHIHKKIREITKDKNYTIEDIVRTCVKAQEAGSKSLR